MKEISCQLFFSGCDRRLVWSRHGKKFLRYYSIGINKLRFFLKFRMDSEKEESLKSLIDLLDDFLERPKYGKFIRVESDMINRQLKNKTSAVVCVCMDKNPDYPF